MTGPWSVDEKGLRAPLSVLIVCVTEITLGATFGRLPNVPTHRVLDAAVLKLEEVPHHLSWWDTLWASDLDDILIVVPPDRVGQDGPMLV